MYLNIWEIIVLLSISQGIIFGIIFIDSKMLTFSENNRFLALSIFLLSIIGLDDLLEHNQIYSRYYILEFFLNDIPWYLLYYVPMFIYFLKSAQHPLANSKILWYLMVPFLLYLFLNIVIDLQVDFRLIEWSVIPEWTSVIYASEYYLSLLYTIILCALSYYIIFQSVLSKEEKHWLKSIWFFNVSILAVWIISEFIRIMFGNWESELNYPVWISFSFFIFWLTFKGLYQLELAKDKATIRKVLNGEKNINKSNITNKDLLSNSESPKLVGHYDAFIQLMRTENLYLNPELNRDEVAQRLNISPSYLSQVIATKSDQNFSAIVNWYRVQKAKVMLADQAFQHFSIVAIGLEAGFKSKSSFYNSFKKETGITPNQFKMLVNEY